MRRNYGFGGACGLRRMCGVWLAVCCSIGWASESLLAGGATYLTRVETQEQLDSISLPGPEGGSVESFTKFLVPLAEDDPIPPLLHDVSQFPFHHDFLRAAFPEHFRELTITQYLEMIEARETRRFLAGTLNRIRTEDGPIWGFDIITTPGEPPNLAEAKHAHTVLQSIFELGEIEYAPFSNDARDTARDWQDPGFPRYLGDSSLQYVPYTLAEGYGRVRLWEHEEFLAANDVGLITWQDILVLSKAPTDIEGVVGGVITAEEQGPLSHVAIRTARRGTPNSFLKNALEELAEYEGDLVRLEVRRTDFTIERVELAEAEAWWADNRPSLSGEPELDRDYKSFDSLTEIDISPDSEVSPESRFGGKASNFARLQKLFDRDDYRKYLEPGFAIPMAHYLDFLRSNRIRLENGSRVTYEEHLDSLLDSKKFQSDPQRRFELLDEFRREARRNSTVSIFLVLQLAARMEEIFGSRDTMTRYRSSSNVEDLLEFNGAGLYNSTAACAADTDGEGPSECDPEEDDERSIGRALALVWSGLWTFRAYEERSFYQIPTDNLAMGILVSRAFLDEKVNGVAFTGNPANSRDRRYVISSQLGEVSVVHPDPGVLPAKDVLLVDRESGEVIDIDRQQKSTLAENGEDVLTDEKLREIARVLWLIDREFPVDLGERSRDEVLFDIEFKIEANDDLAIKQGRPFLLTETPPQVPTFELEVPTGSTLCGLFAQGRAPEEEFSAKSQLRLRPGVHELPADLEVFLADDFIESIEYRTDFVEGQPRGRMEATPVGRGIFRSTTSARRDGSASHTFSFEQEFEIAGGERFFVTISGLEFASRRGEAVELRRVLDDSLITGELFAQGVPDGDTNRRVQFSSCTFPDLPLERIEAQFFDGTEVVLGERFLEARAGTAPAILVSAEVTIDGETQSTDDYWRLVYTALHHNFHVRHWIVLDPPVDVAGVGRVRVIDLDEPQSDTGRSAKARYLDEEFRELGTPKVQFYFRGAHDERPPGFKRGDTDANDIVDLSDAIFLFRALFQGGPQLTCQDAGDFDDDGSFEVNDGVLILTYLFAGVDLSGPPGPETCGRDPSNDALVGCDKPCAVN